MKKYFCSRVVTLLCFVGISSVASAAPIEIYNNDFETGAGSEWTDTTIATSPNGSEKFLGTDKYGFGAGANTLTLSSIAPHTSVTVDFDLYIIRSWDGNGRFGGGPDKWQLTADGTSLLYTNFANYAGNRQAYPSQDPTGGTNAPRTGAYETGHLGWGTGNWGDTTYRLSFTFNHTSSDLALVFTSEQTQSRRDEGWGLDNVKVSVEAVPEPATIALFGSGLIFVFGLTGIRRRKK